ncbi:helix-turn-helix transcriptional regulator [Streptosporangium sp. NPDC000239]|uniref:helix-turn-helix domain-containing protein n=1 Tax=unclassified Streptosporangium TaxID=2632669 RepID=UPI00331AEB6C
MGDVPSLDPGSPRVRFGVEMRRLREAAHLSQSAVAARLGCTQTQISRLEMATRTPSRADAEKLDQIFNLAERQHFVGLHRRIVARPGGPKWFMGWVEEIEPNALALHSWDPLLVPGLLQTEAYARRIFSLEPRITATEVDERVQARMRRRQILDQRNPPSLLVLMDTGVLRRPVGGPEVMREQLDHLLDAVRHPSVSLQLVAPECLPGMLGAFMIAKLPNGDPDIVHVDSSADGRVSSERETVASVWKRYEAIRLWAYPEHASLRMIEEVKKEWT